MYFIQNSERQHTRKYRCVLVQGSLISVYKLCPCHLFYFHYILGLLISQPFVSNLAPLLCLVRCPAMDSSQHAFHYHLARALIHLNQLASFLPSFEIPTDWDSNPNVPRSYPPHSPYQFSRQLHRFVPLPTEPRPPPSLASHGDLPSHFVMNPEPHFQPVIHRDSHPTAHNINHEITYEDIIHIGGGPSSFL